MEHSEPQIVEFLHPIELRIDDYESLTAEIEALAHSSEGADKNVVVDLTGLSAVPNTYVKLIVKTHFEFKAAGRRLLVRANSDLRLALRNSTFGQMLDFEVGQPESDDSAESPEPPSSGPSIASHGDPSDSGPGYEVKDNRLIYHDTSKPWFTQKLIKLLMTLDASATDPAILDLSKLRTVSEADLRRTAHAALHAELNGRQIRLHVLETHASLTSELGIDLLLNTKIIEMMDESGLFPGVGGVKVDTQRLEQLLAERSELPDKVKERTFEGLGPGSYLKMKGVREIRSAKEREETRRRTRHEESSDDQQAYGGPNRRTPIRFHVRDALLDVHKKSGEDTHRTELLDLSEKGSQIFSEQEMFVGEKVALTLNIPDFVGELKVMGRVVWVQKTTDDATHSGYHVGIQFVRVPGGSMIKLRRLEGRHTPE